MGICTWVCAHKFSVLGGLGFGTQESQIIVSHLARVLGTKPGQQLFVTTEPSLQPRELILKHETMYDHPLSIPHKNKTKGTRFFFLERYTFIDVIF